jgi:glycosyltransferase involved in cell wall biosynthesis
MGDGNESALSRLAGASLLYVHVLAPPTPGGVSVVVELLLSRLPVSVDTVTDVALRRRVSRGALRVPGRYHFVPRLPRWGRRPFRIIGVLQTAANVLLAIGAGVRASVLARRRGSRWVLSVADDGFSVIAGSICARLAGRPHLVWVFDPWEENAYAEAECWLARRLERRIWQNAAAIVVHAEEMSRHYARKHGVRCDILPTPVDMDAWNRMPPRRRVAGRDQKEVLVAGAVYWLQAGAVQQLAEACRRLDDVCLTVVAAPELLDAKGVKADRLEAWLPPDRFRARLRSADVLFLGLTFDATAPLAARTSTPARLPEYMASGTPILIHAPPGSHVAEYARREGFGALVDRDDPNLLAHALTELLNGSDTAAERARTGRQLALERHDADRVAAGLARVLARTGEPSRRA